MTATANEWRVFGPPGTGKTTFLSQQISQAAEKHGSDSVIVASFTRAAASELVSRDLPINRDRVGTLHAHCYRAIGSPQIAETQVDLWNQEHPIYKLSEGNKLAGPEDQSFKYDGDEILQSIQKFRAQMLPEHLWGHRVMDFWTRWKDWKDNMGLIDFTDMLEIGYHDFESAPGSPTVGFFDEVQDFTPLELALVRRWGSRMDFFVLAGDDDQCIYKFKGATPDAFLSPEVDKDHKRILPHSYRLPKAIYDYAERWIKRLSVRQAKAYTPREHPGEILKNPGWYMDPIIIVRRAAEYVDSGKTVMILGTCSYMLSPIIKELRRAGIPFHNPYRKKRGDWNPLTPSRGISFGQRVLSFLKVPSGKAADWTGMELKHWIKILQSKKVLMPGAKTRVEDMGDGHQVTLGNLQSFLQPEALERVLAGGNPLRWLKDNVLSQHQSKFKYLHRVIERYSQETLIETPRLIVGTIHSVKGSEADVVFVLPDLSPGGMSEWNGSRKDRDSVIRQFYVAFTRARETLILCRAAGPMSVQM